jgi:two-component system, NarL family, sensor histidine kinase DevS
MAGSTELLLVQLHAQKGLELARASTLLIALEERSELHIRARQGEGRPRVNIAPVEGSALGALYRSGQALQMDRPRGEEAAWLHELGLEARAVLVEPLKIGVRGDGLVIALNSSGSFDAAERNAMKAFAARLADHLREERSVEINRRRAEMEAREHERTRWAREIHDESIQGMGALRLKLANARDENDPQALSESVDAVLEGLGHEIDGLRHLITELRPAALDDLGLAAALQALARRAQAIDGLDVSTEFHLTADPGEADGESPANGRRLDPELESTIYRVVQEALTNVSRHAQATSAAVVISERDGVLSASVTDDGRGLPGAERLGPRGDGLEGGFGMSGMRERAELVGGELEFLPAPGRGTTVRLVVPLERRRAAAIADQRTGPRG